MNVYTKEVQTFYERLEQTPLHASSIALWHALFHIKLRRGGGGKFSVAHAALCLRSGLTESMLEQACRELAEKGLIRYEAQEDGLASIFTMISLVEEGPADHESDEVDGENSENSKMDKNDHGDKGVQREDMLANAIQKKIETTESHAGEEYAACHLQGALKKLDIQDKMLKKDWQQSVNMALQDIQASAETLQQIRRFHPGDKVRVVVQLQASPEAITTPEEEPETITERKRVQKEAEIRPKQSAKASTKSAAMGLGMQNSSRREWTEADTQINEGTNVKTKNAKGTDMCAEMGKKTGEQTSVGRGEKTNAEIGEKPSEKPSEKIRVRTKKSGEKKQMEMDSVTESEELTEVLEPSRDSQHRRSVKKRVAKRSGKKEQKAKDVNQQRRRAKVVVNDEMINIEEQDPTELDTNMGKVVQEIRF